MVADLNRTVTLARTPTRRHLLGLALGFGALNIAPVAAAAQQARRPYPILHPTPRTRAPTRIGVVGSGRVGSMLGELWLRAGHQVMFSDRDPAVLRAIRARLPRARIGTTLEAVRFGEAVLLSVPYSAMPDISRELGGALRGKVVIDTGNPMPGRDGELGRAALIKGSGVSTAEFLPGARVVRGFNAIAVPSMGTEAHRPGVKVGIPIASDSISASAVVQKLVRDAGFDPVVVGPLSTASRFERESPVFGPKTAVELKRLLGLRR